MPPHYYVGESVVAARQLDHVQCPFCGDRAIQSISDIPDDPMQVELYCENGACDVREMRVVAWRAEGHEQERADVMALRAVDEGTAAERARHGHDRRTLSASDAAEMLREARLDGGTLKRRIRPATLTVNAHESWIDAQRAMFPREP